MKTINGTSQIPSSFALHQNYPNPFNSTSTISYDVQKTGKVSLKIYDIYGREVVILVHGKVSARTNSMIKCLQEKCLD